MGLPCLFRAFDLARSGENDLRVADSVFNRCKTASRDKPEKKVGPYA